MPGRPAKHKYERLADALEEYIENEIERRVAFFKINDRLVFTETINDEELLILWQDEASRLKLQMQAMERGGNKEVEELETRAMKAQMNQPSLRERILNG